MFGKRKASQIRPLIYELAQAYYAEQRPGEQAELERTWQAFDEQGLLEGGGVRLPPADTPDAVGVNSEAVSLLASSLVLGVITNAVYDLLKTGAVIAWERLQEPAVQSHLLDQLGVAQAAQREQALSVLHWLQRSGSRFQR